MAADSNWRNMRLHQLPWLEVGRQRWPGWLQRNNLLINNCRIICRICMAAEYQPFIEASDQPEKSLTHSFFFSMSSTCTWYYFENSLESQWESFKHSATLNMKRFGREGRRAAAQARRGSRWGQGGASGRITASCLQIRDSLNIYFRYKEERAARGTS